MLRKRRFTTEAAPTEFFPEQHIARRLPDFESHPSSWCSVIVSRTRRVGPIGRLLRRTTLRENEGETRFLISNLLKVVVQFGDAANRKTNLETVYRGFLMSGVA